LQHLAVGIHHSYSKPMNATRTHYGNLVAAIATVAACDAALGLSLQLIPLVQHARGTPAWLIGLAAAMGPLGILLFGPLMPTFINKYGAKPVAYSAIICILASLFGFAFTTWLPFWFALRFMMGVATATLFTVSETWIIGATTDQNRGRIMGLYVSVLSMSFAMGPLIIPFTGIEGWKPWIIGMVCIAAASLPLTFVNVNSHIGERSHSFFGVFRRAPFLFGAICAATLFDSVFISFFTIFATANGVEISRASTMLGVGVIGSVFLFFPMGWLGDHWTRDKVVISNSIITIICSLLLSSVINSWTAWPIVLLLFGTAAGVYVVSLAAMGDIFKGADVVSGSAAVAAMWGLGGLVGPPLAGAAIDAFGMRAMPFSLAILYAFLLIALFINGGRLAHPVKEHS
jgi:MFS family permease